jgi:antirestriction protein
MERNNQPEQQLMNEKGTEAQEAGSTKPEERKTQTGLAPKIYAASLSDYNAGRLHGAWIDADQDAEEIHADIHNMLAESRQPWAEEWAIHDYEDFGSLRLSEWESIEQLSIIGRGIAEHGTPFAHWATFCRTEGTAEQLSAFQEHYLGVWDSEEAYGEQAMKDYGIQDEIERLLLPHLSGYVTIDYQQFGQDCLSELWTARDEEGLHVFRYEA